MKTVFFWFFLAELQARERACLQGAMTDCVDTVVFCLSLHTARPEHRVVIVIMVHRMRCISTGLEGDLESLFPLSFSQE